MFGTVVCSLREMLGGRNIDLGIINRRLRRLLRIWVGWVGGKLRERYRGLGVNVLWWLIFKEVDKERDVRKYNLVDRERDEFI